MCKFLKIIIKIIIAYFLFSSLCIFGVHQFFIGNTDRGKEYLETFGVMFMISLICTVCALPFLLVSTELAMIILVILGLLTSPFYLVAVLSFTSLFIVDLFTLAFQVIENES
jgi:TM2 domain-containing membrane protein YozV